ncbi:carboxypeptidase-like regulatory domain-containing protein [Salmonirosea aquatica]|uniref:TonB-dependent receptor plug domain-containing protein n=1 Tax=Salmonirosea aquatica TaxID=2654236 RepID=A0A7C9FQ19_9BACT|nr:TonB-dependent receptor plug domain-containing protein [Cytophagaceae bacterium SJW1-29]
MFKPLRLTRLTGLALLLAFLLPASVFSQTLAFVQQRTVRNAPKMVKLKTLLLQVQQHYNVEIVFEDRLVSSQSIASEALDYSLPIERNLDTILRSTNLKFKKIRKGTFVITEVKSGSETSSRALKTDLESVAASLPAEAATTPFQIDTPERAQAEAPKRMVRGTVLDESGTGLPGVSVVIKETTRGTTTNAEGTFELEVPSDESILIFSFVGYKNQELVVGSQQQLSVSMVPESRSLDEVVVVGYGTKKRENVTGAIAQISGEALTSRPITKLGQALQGLIPNLNITNPDGNPNANPTFNIRGTTSLTGGSALVLVDGIQMDMNLLNPADVESITVLKDAASAAIYGARGPSASFWSRPRKVPKTANR